ncbi:hypothetical protein PROFUN_06418 [Planoprotostelium fungivorum]|uniref:Uncharacterized protein n=1 Tax=Planoprotostelium fungivorum TaxID=1890364 RepID=A0A2P6NNU2_9EUKA|nr:hypothetical protein PROFUN_06418 [Planoprotostelium fungivorum]
MPKNTTVEDRLDEFHHFHHEYVRERYGAAIVPGQRMHLPQYQKGKLFMIGVGSSYEQNITLQLFTADGSLLTSSLNTTNYDEIMRKMTEDPKIEVSWENVTVLSSPQPGSPFHYHNDIDVKTPSHPMGGPMYSTFLSSFSDRSTATPSLMDLFMMRVGLQQWRSPRRVIVSSSFVMYWNRLSVNIHLDPHNETRYNTTGKPILRSNLFGIMDSVIYGTYIHLHVSTEVPLYMQSQVYETLDKLRDALKKDEKENTCSELINCTIWTPVSEAIEMRGVDINQVLEAVRRQREVMERLEKDRGTTPFSMLQHILPIAFTVRKHLRSSEHVPFYFTQCIGSQTYPLPILVMISNVLLGGTLIALVVAVGLLSIAIYFISSSLCWLLYRRGSDPLSGYPFLTFVPIQIHLLCLRWPRRRNERAGRDESDVGEIEHRSAEEGTEEGEMTEEAEVTEGTENE